MTERLDLPRRYRDQIEALLREHVPGVEVWAYGSRVSGRSHEGSDLDLVLRGPDLKRVDSGQLGDLIEALEESNVPIIVQVHDWARLPERFHREIEREYVVIQQSVEENSAKENDWETATWGELATLEYGKSLRGYQSSEGPYRVFGTNGPIGWHDKILCTHPSVIIGRKGAYRGVHYSATPFFVIDTAFYLKPKVEMDTRWAYYELLTQDINGLDSGSAIPSTSREDFYGLPVQVPSLPEQRAIAHILGTLDDKIELNRRMNETLEEMARALFKSWFVDFDPVRAKMEERDTGLPLDVADLFPDRLVDSELGEIPEGWEQRTLEDCFNLTMGQSPPGSTYNANGEGVPFFQGSADFGFRYPEKRRYCTAPTRIAELDDTLVSVRAPVGDINMAWERCCIGRGLAALRHKSGSSSFTYYSAWTIQEEVSEYEHSGTVFGAINKKQFEALQVVEPRPELIEAFDTRVGPMDALIRSNTSEVYIFTSIRDTLLPKLISGEIRIRRLEE